MPSISRLFSPRRLAWCLAALLLGVNTPAFAQAPALPGQHIIVRPVKSPLAEETFQTLVVMEGLKRLGYQVQPIQEMDYLAAHMAVANGAATFLADHWSPQQSGFFAQAGGEAKLWRQGVLASHAAMGYMMDKKTANQYGITDISQLKAPQLAALFDNDGDGKADLVGCAPDWECASSIDTHLRSYGLEGTVTQHSGNYPALIAQTIARFEAGQPVLYYAWTPHWVSAVLRPGREAIWLQVPLTATNAGPQALDTRQPNGKNYGFMVNQQHIVANRAWAQANPAAAQWFAQVQIPVDDISAQNQLMHKGENQMADIKRHAHTWIASHQRQFDHWLEQARTAAQACGPAQPSQENRQGNGLPCAP